MKSRAQYNGLISCIRRTGQVLSDRPGGRSDENPSHSFHLRLDDVGDGGDDYVVTITPERMEDSRGSKEGDRDHSEE